MSDDAWTQVWSHWLRARFGTKLSEATLEAAIPHAETVRRMGETLAASPLDNGEMPFANPLPPPEAPEP